MARKKQEIALQAEIETQEEWEEMLAKEGLTVVDIYQEWSGPCKAMVSNFRRLKNELGDDLLRFSVAKADTVESLENYRGKCQPCFACFAGGVLVAIVRGCNSPLLLKTTTEQLAHEHKVLEGNAERKEIKDPLLASMAAKDKPEEDDEEEEEEQRKGVTMAIIKPDVVAEGRVDEVLEKLKDSGIEVLEHIERTMTDEEAREFYAHRKDEEYFEGLIQFMTGGPSHFLVLTKGDTGEGIIDEWRELLGPASVEEAKEQSPESFRAQFGKENYVNALHGSDSQDTAMRELAFFFPDFVVPTVPGSGKKKAAAAPKVERTLALIRPDAMAEKKDEILAKIKEAGFAIAMTKEITLSKEQAEDFYKEHQGQEYFEELTTRMSSGPLLALALARQEAVSGWREMLGPKDVAEAKEQAPDSLRAQFSIEGVPINTLHGADSVSNAEKELEYFFPMQQTVAVIKPDGYQTKDEIMKRIKEAGFHIAARKETELSKEVAEEFYKDQQGKEYYGDLIEHMTSGPTLFMVLSREDAVDGWRSLLGPTDPNQAKQSNPDTLRAKFGTDIKQNAIHGSSNPEQAQNSIKLVFGDLEFNKDEEEQQSQKEAEQSREQTQVESQAGDKTETQEQKQHDEESEKKDEGQDTKEESKETAEGGEEGGEKQEEQTQDTEGEEKKEEQPSVEQKEEDRPASGQQAETTQEEKTQEEGEQKQQEGDDKKEEAGEEQKPAESDEKPAEESEQKPDESEQKPDESEQKPADESEQKPADESEQKPAEGEDKPAEESEQKPDEGKTEESEQKPAESSEATPATADEEKPAESQEKSEIKPATPAPATQSEETPAEGEEKTAETEQEEKKPDEEEENKE